MELYVPPKYRKDEASRQGYTFGATSPRPLSTIAREIRATWKNIYFGAVPYLDAMDSLNTIADKYGSDSAQQIVAYFLSNARAWKGGVAKHIKAELQGMLDVERR